MNAPILAPFQNSPEIVELFWALSEFTPLEEDTPKDFVLESGEPLQVVGRDGCGGRFCLFPASDDYSGHLLYVDSEGGAGVIGASLSEGIRMMIALPNWRECLGRSKGSIDEMRKTQTEMEIDLLERYPTISTIRQSMYRAFNLNEMTNPVEVLHKAVSEGSNIKVMSTHHSHPYENLFRNSGVED